MAIKNGLHATVRYDTVDSYQLDKTCIIKLLEVPAHSFSVQTKHAQCLLIASSAKERDDWYNAISQAIQSIQSIKSIPKCTV